METAGRHGRVSGGGRGVGRVRGVSKTRSVLAQGSVPPAPVPAPRSFQPGSCSCRDFAAGHGAVGVLPASAACPLLAFCRPPRRTSMQGAGL